MWFINLLNLPYMNSIESSHDNITKFRKVYYVMYLRKSQNNHTQLTQFGMSNRFISK